MITHLAEQSHPTKQLKPICGSEDKKLFSRKHVKDFLMAGDRCEACHARYVAELREQLSVASDRAIQFEVDLISVAKLAVHLADKLHSVHDNMDKTTFFKVCKVRDYLKNNGHNK